MKPTPLSEEKDLLLQLRRGDHRAFEQLYKQHSRPLLAMLDKRLADPQEADDILQELFVKVWERRAQVDPEKPFAGYLYRIGQRMVVDHYRRLARLAVVHNEVQHGQTELSNSTDEQVAHKETEALLQQAVAQLPKQQGRAFRLCKLEGKSYKEAAEIMQISPETVHAHLAKAMQSVKAYFQTNHYPLTGLIALLL